MPGFTITGRQNWSTTGSAWGAVRNLDGLRVVLEVVPAADVTEARTEAGQLMAVLDQVHSEHVVRLHEAIAVADGTLALVLDQASGVTLAQILGARGLLTPGEIVTTLTPLLGALADLHAAGLVHGDVAPANVLFSSDGRPLISNPGVVRLLRRQATPTEGPAGLVAPEVVAGAQPSAASDVYAMAALGWLCLTGDLPASATRRPSLTTSRPEVPPGLVEVLTSCLAADPAVRPSPGAAAVALFDAAPAESVALVTVSDPATEITRRIRAAAVSAPTLAAASNRKRQRGPLAIGVVAVLVAGVFGGGATWFLRRPAVPDKPAVFRSAAHPAPSSVAPPMASQDTTDVLTAPGSPRIAAAGLLQALVSSRALAYVARSSALLDLVYAPGASGAGVDQGNIATALKKGGTYLGLAFVVKDVAFLDGTPGTARIRATILTPAYQTGRPDGRKVPHAQDITGPSVFTLRLTPDGWRILGLTAA